MKRFLLILLFPYSFLFAEEASLFVGFAEPMAGSNYPKSWEPIQFSKIENQTKYTVTEEGGGLVIHAQSKNSASGLMRVLDINPQDFPVLSWSWKIEKLKMSGNLRTKEGDDCPARILVAFGGSVKRPKKAIAYVWAPEKMSQAALSSPYTSRIKLIPVRDISADTGKWFQEKRNVYEDYEKLFGQSPPAITGIMIMSDTDNTKSQVTAVFGAIRFSKYTHQK